MALNKINFDRQYNNKQSKNMRGSCFPKVLELVVEEPFVSLIHARKTPRPHTSSRELLRDPPCPRKTGERSCWRSHVWEIWKSLIVIAITQHSSSSSSKERNHDRTRQSQHVWLQNVEMRATHQASLCSVWMGDADLWDIREYLLSWRVLSRQ